MSEIRGAAQQLQGAQTVAQDGQRQQEVRQEREERRAERNDEARRFINLIDLLYEHRVNLLCGAEAVPGGLYDGAKAPPAFARTVSRLEEMQSEAYLAAPHLG